jgi:hypothetical protein
MPRVCDSPPGAPCRKQGQDLDLREVRLTNCASAAGMHAGARTILCSGLVLKGRGAPSGDRDTSGPSAAALRQLLLAVLQFRPAFRHNTIY